MTGATYSRRHRLHRVTSAGELPHTGVTTQSAVKRKRAASDADDLEDAPALFDKSNATSKKARLNLSASKHRRTPARAFNVMHDDTPSPTRKRVTQSTPNPRRQAGPVMPLAVPDAIPVIEPIAEGSSEMDVDMPSATVPTAAHASTTAPTRTPKRTHHRKRSNGSSLPSEGAADDEGSSPLPPKQSSSPSPGKGRPWTDRIDAHAYARQQRRRSTRSRGTDESLSSGSEDSLAERLKHSIGLQDDEAFFQGRTKRRVLSNGRRSSGVKGRPTLRMHIRDEPAVNRASSSSDPIAAALPS